MVIKDLWGEKPLTDEAWLLQADQISDFLLQDLKMQWQKQPPGLSNIEIETINRCNNDCSFCPANRNMNTRPLQYMDKELFVKIIDELEKMDYRGHISLYSNNEPLLDKRIFSWIAYAKQKLPLATHIFFTNGLLLDAGKLQRLEQMLDKIVIDIYSETSQVPEKFLWLQDYVCEAGGKTKAVLRNKNQVLTTRGGTAPNKQTRQVFSSFCLYPYIQMVIRPDGKVSKCCHDAYGQTTVGDLTKQTIEEVWTGSRFSRIRNCFFTEGRTSVTGCTHCDVLVYDCALENQVKKSMRQRLVRQIEKQAALGKRFYVCGSGEKSRGMKETLEQLGIAYKELTENMKEELLHEPKAYLIAQHYSETAVCMFMQSGKQVLEDYIVYFRCF